MLESKGTNLHFPKKRSMYTLD